MEGYTSLKPKSARGSPELPCSSKGGTWDQRRKGKNCDKEEREGQRKTEGGKKAP